MERKECNKSLTISCLTAAVDVTNFGLLYVRTGVALIHKFDPFGND